MAFEFDIPARREASDEEILQGIRRFVRMNRNGTATFRRFLMWRDRPSGEGLIYARFGSWRKAVAKSGATPRHMQEMDAEEMIRNLERVWRKIGYPPGQRLLRVHGRYAASSYCDRWGSVKRACKLLAAVHSGRLTRAEMIARGRNARQRRLRRALRLGLRWQVLERDGFVCTACGTRPAKPRRGVGLHVDHIVPVSLGGSNDPSNLRTLCADCNVGRGAGRRRLEKSE